MKVKPTPLVITITVLSFLVVLSQKKIPIIYNPTKSLPKGFYLLKEAKNIKKGDLVIFKRLERHRNLAFLKDLPVLLKPIGAIAGESYCMNRESLTLNGKRYEALVYNLIEKQGCFRVKRGNFLVLSAYSNRSFDSRYFAEISREVITHVAVPLLTF